MDETDDVQLLRRFVEDDSADAFAALVQRQIGLVYSAALRQTRNPHAAEEVTQAVFIVLARKAKGLLHLNTLTGWLYQAARLTAANYLRDESRRARREQEAYMQGLLNEPDPSLELAWTQCSPLLEDAMGELGAGDRDAILLRYFQNKNLRDVGATLGINEDAARMRVNRALEKLRRLLAKRGAKLTAVAIAGALSSHSVQAAPADLSANVLAEVAQGFVLESSVAALVAGTIKSLAWIRYRFWIGLGASAVLIAAATTSIVLWQNKSRSQKNIRIVPAVATIAKVGPFQGTASENFDSLDLSVQLQSVKILGGSAAVTNLTKGGALKYVAGSSLGGKLVSSRSAPYMLGQLGISEWAFNPPLLKFGGYFANNSRFDDATVDFYDVHEALIGSVTVSVPKDKRGWTWNGWQSGVPIHRLVITGKDSEFYHGFIWFDDIQVAQALPVAMTPR